MTVLPPRPSLAVLSVLAMSACVADPYGETQYSYLTSSGPQRYVSTARTADPPPRPAFEFENTRPSVLDVETFRQPSAAEREQNLTAQRLAQYQLAAAAAAPESRWSTSMYPQASAASVPVAQQRPAAASALPAARATAAPPRPAAASRAVAPIVRDGNCFVRLADGAADAGLYPVLCPDAMNWKKVQELQIALKCNGYDPGPIDGKLGPLTIAGVNAYRRAYRLPSHAYVDVDTLRALGVSGY